MGLLIMNQAEAQTSGTAVTSGGGNTGDAVSTAFDEAVIGTNMTLTFDNGHPQTGANSYKLALTSTATAITYLGWTGAVIGAPVRRMFGSVSYWSNRVPASSTCRFIQFLNGSTVLGYIGITNSGTGNIQFRSSADAAIGTAGTAMSASTLYRVDFDVFFDATLGSGRCVWWQGTSRNAADAFFSNVAFGTSAGCDHVRFGCTTANFSSTSGDSISYDDITLSDQAQVNLAPKIYLPSLRFTPVTRVPMASPTYPAANVGPAVIQQALTATATTTATIVKSVGKGLSATSTTTASLVKSVGKPLSATVTTTASLAKAIIRALTLTATVTTTASIVKSAGKVLSGTVTTTASMVRSVGKLLSATATTTASVVKSVGKKLTATSTTTATLAASRAFLKALTATVSNTATISRSVGKLLSPTVTTSASITKRVGKSLSATVSSTASLIADYVAQLVGPFAASLALVDVRNVMVSVADQASVDVVIQDAQISSAPAYDVGAYDTGLYDSPSYDTGTYDAGLYDGFASIGGLSLVDLSGASVETHDLDLAAVKIADLVP